MGGQGFANGLDLGIKDLVDFCNMTAPGSVADQSIAFIESRSMSVNPQQSSNDLKKINGSMHCLSRPFKRARFTAEMSSVLLAKLVKKVERIRRGAVAWKSVHLRGE
jgi:hypothetical protein